MKFYWEILRSITEKTGVRKLAFFSDVPDDILYKWQEEEGRTHQFERPLRTVQVAAQEGHPELLLELCRRSGYTACKSVEAHIITEPEALEVTSKLVKETSEAINAFIEQGHGKAVTVQELERIEKEIYEAREALTEALELVKGSAV